MKKVNEAKEIRIEKNVNDWSIFINEENLGCGALEDLIDDLNGYIEMYEMDEHQPR